METKILVRLYQVGYTKATGGQNIITVKARSRSEALSNAKNIRHTGKKFYIVREVKKAKVTAVGGVGFRQSLRSKLRQRGKYKYKQ